MHCLVGVIERAVTTTDELLSLLAAQQQASQASLISSDPNDAATDSRSGSTLDNAAAERAAAVAAVQSQFKGVFSTTIAFAPGAIMFSPDESAVLGELHSVVEGVINVAQQAPRLLFMRAFAQYFEGKPSGLNPVSIIRGTPRFVELRSYINDAVLADFGQAREYVKVIGRDSYRSLSRTA